jgi:hypothetical protein
MPLIPPNRVVVFPLKDDLQWYDPEVVFRPFDDLFGRGVVGSTDLQVIANTPADGQITVRAGRGYVPYTNGGKRYFSTPVDIASSAAEFVRSVPSWPGGNPRVDRVVAKILDATITPGEIQKGGVFDVIPGTPTAGATLANLSGAASVPANTLLLGNVLANGATIPSGNVDSTFGVVRARATIGLGNSPGATQFEKNGAALTQRAKLNFIEGSGVTITAVDDPVNDEIDMTLAAAGSTIKLFDYTVAGSSKASIDTFADGGNVNLPAKDTYIIRGRVQGDAAGNSTAIRCHFNNDTLAGNAHYDNGSYYINQAGVLAVYENGQAIDGFRLSDINCAGTSGSWSTFEMKIIFDYLTAGRINFLYDAIFPFPGNNTLNRYMGGGVYHSAAALTRLRYFTGSGNFAVGSRIQVWGM